ncbi:MAG: hypothetical protein JNJ58_11540 [Chitinophagaceae bacterium]|nr:hypothetical protein [Chitinophagaceae bacterium]
MMKQISVFLISFCLCVAFTACHSTREASASADTETPVAEEKKTPDAKTAPVQNKTPRVLKPMDNPSRTRETDRKLENE